MNNINKFTQNDINASNLILSKCLNEKDFQYFSINLHFQALNVFYNSVFQWIRWYKDTYQKHPSILEIKYQYPNFEYDNNCNDYSNEYLKDVLMKNFKKHTLLKSLEDFTLKLDDNNVDEALTYFSSSLKKIDNINNQRQNSVSLFRDSESVLSMPPVRGWSYGLPSLDKHIGGILPGQFITIVARPKGNKSWMSRFIAYNLLKQGVDVFYVSLETDKKNELKNFISIASQIDPFMLMQGILTNEERAKIKRVISELAELEKKQKFEIMDASDFSRLTPSTIFATVEAKAENLENTVIFIDQASWLFDDEASKDPVSVLTNISKATIAYTQVSKIPVIMLLQAKREATAKILPSAQDIQWSDRPLQDCHVALGLGATPDMKRNNQKYIKTIAQRVGTETCLLADFNISKGILRESMGDIEDPDETAKKEQSL